MRVHVVDPFAYTPPYDHALAAALARAGAQVELVTAAFRHGDAPEPDGYVRVEHFGGDTPLARAARHLPDMARYGRRARRADVVHYQWLPLQQLDWLVLPRKRPRVITAHDILPREASPGQRAAQRRIYARMDAVVVHSEHGARRLRAEAGVPAERIRVIPHGAFDHLATVAPGALPPELAGGAGRRVALFFGLVRPYKGVEDLLDAWRLASPDAELWIVGMPRMDLAPLRAAAPSGVRWVPRFVSDAELAAVFRAADVVVLPYREIDQSGVLYTALAFDKPLLLTRVGGFPEVAGATLVAPRDPPALADALGRMLADPPRPPPRAPAHDWAAIARRTLALYEELTKTM